MRKIWKQSFVGQVLVSCSLLLLFFGKLVRGLKILERYSVATGESLLDLTDHLSLNLDFTQRTFHNTCSLCLLVGGDLVDGDGGLAFVAQVTRHLLQVDLVELKATHPRDFLVPVLESFNFDFWHNPRVKCARLLFY